MNLQEALEMHTPIPDWVRIVEAEANSGDREPGFGITGRFPDGQYDDYILKGEEMATTLALYEGAEDVTLTVYLPVPL